MALTLTTLVAGCGGAHKTEPSAVSSTPAVASSSLPASPSHPGGARSNSSLIATADAICARLNAEFKAHKPASDALSEVARLSPSRAAREMATVNELGALRPLPALAGGWRKVVGYRRQLALELAELGRAAKSNDRAGVQRLAAAKVRVHQALSAISKQYGFKDCGTIA